MKQRSTFPTAGTRARKGPYLEVSRGLTFIFKTQAEEELSRPNKASEGT